jgi:CHAT domain-containing protein/tetratricopeptide (TPR) repeat protein
MLPWLVRRCETAPYVVPVGVVDTIGTKGTISFARRIRSVDSETQHEDVFRLRVAASRGQLHLGEFRAAAATTLELLGEDTARSPLPPRVAYDAWLIRARALTYLGAADSGRAAADSARRIAQGVWATALDRAWADFWLGWVNQRLISAATACALFRTALPALDAAVPELDRDLLGVHVSLGAALVAAGDIRGSVAEYRRILGSLERAAATENTIYALVLEQLGARERRLGDYVAARRDGERSVELFKRLLGEHNEDYGFASTILGGALRDLGDLEGAERATRVGIDVMAARLGVMNSRIPEGYNGLAIIYRRMGRLDSALSCIERSHAAYLAHRNPRDTEQYNTLATYANVLGDLGRYEESARMADSAAIGMTALVGPNHHYVPSILLVQATAERGCGRDSTALVLLDTVIARRVRTYGSLHPDVQDALTERALTNALIGRTAPAMRDALEAMRQQRGIRQALLRGLEERTALAVILRPKWTALDVALNLAATKSLAPSDLPKLYDEVVRQRLQLFDELLARRHEVAGDTALTNQRARLARVRSDIAGVLLSGGDRTRTTLDSLSRIEETLETQMSAAAVAGTPTVQQISGVGLDELRAALPTGSALVSIVRFGAFDPHQAATRWGPRTKPAYAAFVLRQGSTELRHLDLGNAAGIDSLTTEWLGLNGGRRGTASNANLRGVGRALRKRAFDGILGATKGADRVYLVLDGPLSLVDPGTLPDDADGYLLERPQRLLLLSGERELLEQARPTSHGGGGLLALGGPEFNGTTSPDPADGLETSQEPERFSSCDEVKLGRFGPLPASAAEVIAISTRWRAWAHGDTTRDALVLLGALARERALRNSCRGRIAIHLATHGFALHDDCEAWSPEAAEVFRSLYRTGLALAGSNARSVNTDPSDDGLLTAGEASELDLSGASWVCLSACESGLGDAISGEGVQGLVRAFRIAGARQVVMSLWPVADDDAAEWNDAFYGGLLDRSLSVTEASREASLRLLRARRAVHGSTRPATWACFAVSGIDR